MPEYWQSIRACAGEGVKHIHDFDPNSNPTESSYNYTCFTEKHIQYFGKKFVPHGEYAQKHAPKAFPRTQPEQDCANLPGHMDEFGKQGQTLVPMTEMPCAEAKVWHSCTCCCMHVAKVFVEII